MLVKRSKGHRVSTCIQLILCLAMLYAINVLWFSKEVAIREKKRAESMLAQAETKLKEIKWTRRGKDPKAILQKSVVPQSRRSAS